MIKFKFLRTAFMVIGLILISSDVKQLMAQEKPEKLLPKLQQQFIDLAFGMFIHYNIPTYIEDDWPEDEKFHSSPCYC
ncbi:hypothetical protein [Arcticibacter eurypsychrophilus]|uniref:hypothetical protein n=1 Tax=Arcticibacter eurypsychrophilus TaxID=1434752 RepID=UPI00084DBCFA|nr:hypothetical protein [Arcticibacter eurypsychrophilus]